MPRFKDFETLQTINAWSDGNKPGGLFPAGTVVGQGRFELIKLLGHGGTGLVYLARDREIHGEEIAVKMIWPGLLAAEEAKTLLRHEIQAARRLNHANILRIFELYPDKDLTFLTMEYIDGPSLRAWMHQQTQIPLAQVDVLIRQICQGLDYAHQHLVHGDIKPENILLRPKPQALWEIKIADFGLARFKFGERATIAPVGTFPYIAPEQCQPGAVTSPDPRSDIYAVGVILYELLTGRLPLGYFKHPSQLRSDVSGALDQVICRALTSEPQERFSSVAELAAAYVAATPIRFQGKYEPGHDAPGEQSLQEERFATEAWHTTVANFVRSSHGFWSYTAYQMLVQKVAEQFPDVSEMQLAQRLEEERQAFLPSLSSECLCEEGSLAEKLRENLCKVKSSGLIQEFVHQAKGEWRHHWPQFLQKLRDVRLYPVKESELQQVVSDEYALYEKLRQEIKTAYDYMEVLLAEGETEAAQSLIAQLLQRGVPPQDLQIWQRQLDERAQNFQNLTSTADALVAQRHYGQALATLQQASLLKPKCSELTQKITEVKSKADAVQQAVATALTQSQALAALGEYAKALETLEMVALYGHADVDKWQKELRQKVEELAKARQKISNVWFTEPISPEKSPLAHAATHLPLADFTGGVSFLLARFYQEEYARRSRLPVEITIPLPDDASFVLRLVPPGRFLMGGEEAFPIHEVAIATPFYCSIYPLTQEQWEAVLGEPPVVLKGPFYPVERVSWEDCQQFIHRLSALTEKKFSLVSEAQWEYACRAGSAGSYCYPEAEVKLTELAWYAENSGGVTHPVGQKRPNAWGLCDMHGQVWEWCQDWYGPYPASPDTDPQGCPDGSEKILRGGNVYAPAGQCTSCYRSKAKPYQSTQMTGLRLAMPVSSS